MPVNDLSWSMWGAWSCFYADTIEAAVNEDAMIKNDIRAIRDAHKKGKYILGGLSDCVAQRTLKRGEDALKELVRTSRRLPGLPRRGLDGLAVVVA